MGVLSDAQYNVLVAFLAENIEPNTEKHGVEILVGLFKKSKSSQMLFEKFKNLATEAEMRNCPELKKHGDLVVKTLLSVIKKKGSHESELRKLACSHVNQHKIPVEEFQVIFSVINDYLRTVPACTADISNSMNTVLDDIYDCLKEHYKKEKK
ncbi:myoglobin-like [Protopterus annectens]|uniref:myoglobin-like n=1 Tax=Protopterus annectens TaxID=7888 RepID=UPI001CFAF183|nr:myoglobin-like [Protopterus annectens]